MPARIPIDWPRLTRLCQRHQIVKLALFGSVLREDFRSESDVDVLIAFDAAASPTLLALMEIEAELRALFGRDVDVLTWHGVQESRNPARRHAILQSAEVIYDAA